MWRSLVVPCLLLVMAAAAAAAEPLLVDSHQLRLTYVTPSRPDKPGTLGLLFGGPQGTWPLVSNRVRAAAKLLEDTFYVALAVPAPALWVNLTPNEPDRVCDPRLRKVEMGRAFVNADMQMKVDAAVLTDPRKSGLGKDFWDQIRRLAAGGRLKTGCRMWIVPGEMDLVSDGTGCYLHAMHLRVQLETERFMASNNPTGLGDVDRLNRLMILPEIERKLNEDPIYAPMRQVYSAIILARWYKDHFRGTKQPAADLIDSDSVAGRELADGWTPQGVYEQYMRSYQQGEYNFTERVQESLGNGVVRIQTRHYFRGGVDLRQMVLPPPLPATDTQRQDVAMAFQEGEVQVQDGTILFTTPPAPASTEPAAQ
jgi:hypothetical protein